MPAQTAGECISTLLGRMESEPEALTEILDALEFVEGDVRATMGEVGMLLPPAGVEDGDEILQRSFEALDLLLQGCAYLRRLACSRRPEDPERARLLAQAGQLLIEAVKDNSNRCIEALVATSQSIERGYSQSSLRPGLSSTWGAAPAPDTRTDLP